MVTFTGDVGIELPNVGHVGYKSEYTARTSTLSKYQAIERRSSDVGGTKHQLVLVKVHSRAVHIDVQVVVVDDAAGQQVVQLTASTKEVLILTDVPEVLTDVNVTKFKKSTDDYKTHTLGDEFVTKLTTGGNEYQDNFAGRSYTWREIVSPLVL